MGMKRFGDIKGFTFFEVVLIIVITAVLSYTLFIKSTDFYTIKLDSAARKLASDMRFAQQLAMTRQVRNGVVFNWTVACPPVAANHTYTVFEEKGACPTVDTPARNPSGGGNLTVDYNTDAQFKGVTITSPSFCVGATCTETLEFDAQGAPTDVAGTQLDSGSVMLNYPGATSKTITVTPSTGKVSY